MNEEVECKTHPDAPHGFVRNASHTEDRLVCECEYWEEPKMNKRIRQLAIEANLISPESNGFDQTNLSKAHQKFAELIVEESIKVLMENDYHGEWLGEKIKEHFGVEE